MAVAARGCGRYATGVAAVATNERMPSLELDGMGERPDLHERFLLLRLRSDQEGVTGRAITADRLARRVLVLAVVATKTAGILAEHKKRLKLQLVALDTATTIDDMDIPGFRLHPLKGKRKGIWSISVSGNWRLTFEFEEGNVYILHSEDYH